MKYDPLTEWRGKHTPYWLDEPRPDVEVRALRQMDELRHAATAAAQLKEKEDASAPVGGASGFD